MSYRAIILGALLALAIASVTYFNDQIVRQTYLINNHLPASVFGPGILLLLALNPLLRWSRLARPLALAEVGLILAMGLAVCAWPGTSLMRYVTHMLVLPAVNEPAEPAWRASQVLAYVPGEHGRVGAGHLRDVDALHGRLTQASAEIDPPAYRFARRLPAALRDADVELTRRELAEALTDVLQSPDVYERQAFAHVAPRAPAAALIDRHERGELSAERVVWLNRLLLEATFADEIVPLRRGAGVLVAEGRLDDEVVDPLLWSEMEGRITPAAVPWDKWWPTIRLWGSAVALMAVAVLCMILIVHPQWSRRELLSYPTVRLVEELAATEPRGRWPAVLGNKIFWYGVAAVAVLHVVNGLNAWFPALPTITRQFDFTPLGELFPNARRASGSWQLLQPTIYPAVIGFAFLIQARIALSVGLALPLWVMFSAVLIRAGVSVSNHRTAIDSMGPQLRFGAFLGLTLMVLYFGRHYYAAVARAALGLARAAAVPRYAPSAARGLVLCSAGASLAIWHWAGLELWLAAAVVLMVLMASLVMARINAETGLFYAQPDWYPVMMLLAFLGWPALGPELMVVLLMASFLLMPDPREGLAPFLVNALRLLDVKGSAGPQRGVPWVGLAMLGGLATAFVVTLTLQHYYGLSMQDHWAPRQAHNVFAPLAAGISELAARQELTASLTAEGLTERLHLAQPSWAMVGWSTLGLALVVAAAGASLRLPWWPIHPVLFVIWGTFPSYFFGISFLLGAIVKFGVIRIGGERAYHTLKPMMIGLIAAELLMILLWSAVGISYFLATGQTPAQYYILPN